MVFQTNIGLNRNFTLICSIFIDDSLVLNWVQPCWKVAQRRQMETFSHTLWIYVPSHLVVRNSRLQLALIRPSIFRRHRLIAHPACTSCGSSIHPLSLWLLLLLLLEVTGDWSPPQRFFGVKAGSRPGQAPGLWQGHTSLNCGQKPKNQNGTQTAAGTSEPAAEPPCWCHKIAANLFLQK